MSPPWGSSCFLNNASIGVYAALVHEPSYRDDWLGAVGGVLEDMLERDVLPVQVGFRDGSGNAWDQVLVLFVGNDAASTPEGRIGQLAGLVRLGRLPGRAAA